MGLMLSVLVFSVGVIEALSCYEHFRQGYISLDGAPNLSLPPPKSPPPGSPLWYPSAPEPDEDSEAESTASSVRSVILNEKALQQPPVASHQHTPVCPPPNELSSSQIYAERNDVIINQDFTSSPVAAENNIEARRHNYPRNVSDIDVTSIEADVELEDELISSTDVSDLQAQILGRQGVKPATEPMIGDLQTGKIDVNRSLASLPSPSTKEETSELKSLPCQREAIEAVKDIKGTESGATQKPDVIEELIEGSLKGIEETVESTGKQPKEAARVAEASEIKSPPHQKESPLEAPSEARQKPDMIEELCPGEAEQIETAIRESLKSTEQTVQPTEGQPEEAASRSKDETPDIKSPPHQQEPSLEAVSNASGTRQKPDMIEELCPGEAEQIEAAISESLKSTEQTVQSTTTTGAQPEVATSRSKEEALNELKSQSSNTESTSPKPDMIEELCPEEAEQIEAAINESLKSTEQTVQSTTTTETARRSKEEPTISEQISPSSVTEEVSSEKFQEIPKVKENEPIEAISRPEDFLPKAIQEEGPKTDTKNDETSKERITQEQNMEAIQEKNIKEEISHTDSPKQQVIHEEPNVVKEMAECPKHETIQAKSVDSVGQEVYHEAVIQEQLVASGEKGGHEAEMSNELAPAEKPKAAKEIEVGPKDLNGKVEAFEEVNQIGTIEDSHKQDEGSKRLSEPAKQGVAREEPTKGTQIDAKSPRPQEVSQEEEKSKGPKADESVKTQTAEVNTRPEQVQEVQMVIDERDKSFETDQNEASKVEESQRVMETPEKPSDEIVQEPQKIPLSDQKPAEIEEAPKEQPMKPEKAPEKKDKKLIKENDRNIPSPSRSVKVSEEVLHTRVIKEPEKLKATSDRNQGTSSLIQVVDETAKATEDDTEPAEVISTQEMKDVTGNKEDMKEGGNIQGEVKLAIKEGLEMEDKREQHQVHDIHVVKEKGETLIEPDDRTATLEDKGETHDAATPAVDTKQISIDQPGDERKVTHEIVNLTSRKEPDEGEVVKVEPAFENSPTPDSSPEKAFWLIFSGEYTKAMSKDWHSGHFCCWQCDESLTGQRYVLRDDHSYCIKCYESVFANACEECNRTIGIDSKDLSYKDKHWHEACFLCSKCRVSLVDKQFGSKADKIYCGNCYDAQFASRCDGCGQIFRAGTKKMEYKTRQWHEQCFCCCVCKTPIGTKSFIPREQEIYCATCYEEKFATRCIKCNKIITSGGVTYKNEPWHRECFTCTNCNTSLAGQRFTSREEKPYCAECFGELFAKRCTACSKPITGIGGTRFISFEDRHWHNDCFICAMCKTSLVGRGFITDEDDIICPECAKQKLM